MECAVFRQRWSGGDERSQQRMARAAVHLDTGDQLWLRCADEHALDAGDRVTVKAFVRFDKRNHLYALDRLLDGQVAGDWPALAALLTDRTELAALGPDPGESPGLDPDLDDDQRLAVLGALRAPCRSQVLVFVLASRRRLIPPPAGC